MIPEGCRVNTDLAFRGLSAGPEEINRVADEVMVSMVVLDSLCASDLAVYLRL